MNVKTQTPRGTERAAKGPKEKMKRTEGLYEFVKPLASLSAGMLYLAEAGHERLTINQAAFFLLVAAADARGAPLTLQEILDSTEGIIGRSIQNSYKVLLEPRGRDPKDYALGWLSREVDPDDERRKYLRLTQKGRDVASAVMLATGQLKAH
jgi:hypothetical protein